MYNKSNVMQYIKNINTIHKLNFNEFINNCDVEEVGNKEYELYYLEDYELKLCIEVCDMKGMILKDNDGVDMWKVEQTERAFLKLGLWLDDRKEVVSDYDVREEQGIFGYGY